MVLVCLKIKGTWNYTAVEKEECMGNLSLKKFTQFALVLALVYLGVSYLPDILGFGGSILDAASPLIWGCVIA